jgi:RNA polymerase sigma-70 factor, ECF subfamily
MDDPKKLSTQALLQLCLDSQDKEIAMALWAEFVRRFQPLIAGVVTKCVFRRGRANPALVDDLVQETYLKLCANNFKALRGFDFQHENALFGFLKVVAANVVEDYYRRRHNQKRGSGREEEDIEEARTAVPSNIRVFQPVEHAVLLGQIRKCLAEQAGEPNFVRDYSIFWLYFGQGLTAKAISRLPSIGLSVKGVESTLLRLVRLLRAKMTIPPRKRGAGG